VVSMNTMTNILSFSLVKSEYDITYDGDAFIIHQAAKGYSDMVFKPHKSRLHVYDLDDPRGLASHCFMETVESTCRCSPRGRFTVQILPATSKQAWRFRPMQI
jgi:hypothetical protein